MESCVSILKQAFVPKVILVNHENHFDVDTNCTNIAIKFNMLYLPVSHLIRENIQNDTEIGK